MAIRIRTVGGQTIAVCAAISEPQPGDLYLDDSMHHALSTKFGLDWHQEGLINDACADPALVPLMLEAQGGWHPGGRSPTIPCNQPPFCAR